MRTLLAAALVVSGLLLSGCTGTTTTTQTGTQAPNPYPAPSTAVRVPGGGSSFAFPIIDAWRSVYTDQQPAVQLNYEKKGSGAGRTTLEASDYLFAGSDAPLSAKERSGYPSILTFPESLGPIAVVYNVDGVGNGMHLEGDILGKIYTGAIKSWNDPAIAAANPGVALPSAPITAVHRVDKSGTTFVFTDYLGKASPAWAAAVGAAASQLPDWANKTTAKQDSGSGNDGVALAVGKDANSIGYVELSYVKDLHAAALMNKNGQYLMPTTDGATKAAEAFAGTLPAADGDWGKVSIVDAPGDGAYPLSTFTYLMVKSHVSDYGGKFNADQMQGFKNFAWWALHDGQAYADSLGYAPLPASVVAIGENALQMIG